MAVSSKMAETAISFDRSPVQIGEKGVPWKGPSQRSVSVFPELLRIRLASLRGSRRYPNLLVCAFPPRSRTFP